MAAPIVGETRIGIRLAWRRRAPSRGRCPVRKTGHDPTMGFNAARWKS